MDFERNIGQLHKLHEQISAQPSVQANTVDFWLDSFLRWQNATAPPPGALVANDVSAQYKQNTSQAKGDKDFVIAGLNNSSDVIGDIDVIQNNSGQEGQSPSATGGGTYPVQPAGLLQNMLHFLTTDNGRVYWRFIKFDNIKQPTQIVVRFLGIKCFMSKYMACGKLKKYFYI